MILPSDCSRRLGARGFRDEDIYPSVGAHGAGGGCWRRLRDVVVAYVSRAPASGPVHAGDREAKWTLNRINAVGAGAQVFWP